MSNIDNRYEQMETFMTYVLIGNAALFFLYLLFAGLGVLWLKILLSIIVILVSLGCLALLYISQELPRTRSRWMTVASASTLICTLFSLILSFP